VADADTAVVSLIRICSFMGLCVGGYVPVVAWGASDFSLQSLVFGALGGLAGVWVGYRLSN